MPNRLLLPSRFPLAFFPFLQFLCRYIFVLWPNGIVPCYVLGELMMMEYILWNGWMHKKKATNQWPASERYIFRMLQRAHNNEHNARVIKWVKMTSEEGGHCIGGLVGQLMNE